MMRKQMTALRCVGLLLVLAALGSASCKVRRSQESQIKDFETVDEDTLVEDFLNAMAEALPATMPGGATPSGDSGPGAQLTDGGGEPLRNEAERLKRAFERRKEESQVKVKEAQDRLRRARTRDKACVLGPEGSYCVCQAESKDGAKKVVGWAPMPGENQVGLDYLSHEEKLDGFSTALNLMVEGKIQSSACEGAKVVLEKRGLSVNPISGSSASSRNCSCRSAVDGELASLGIDPQIPAQEKDKTIVIPVAPVVQVVCEQRYRITDTIAAQVENPEAFQRYFFSTALAFVTGPIRSSKTPLADLAAVGCTDLNLPAINKAMGTVQPRWMNACNDFAKKSQISSINPNVHCDGARPLGDDLLAIDPQQREGCRCYFGDSNLAARMREFQLKRLQNLAPILADIAKLDKENQSIEENARALNRDVDTALSAATAATGAVKKARLPSVAVLETDPAGVALQQLQDRLHNLSAGIQRSKEFVGSALKAQISGLTNLNVFSTLTPGKTYENLPRFSATWLYVDFDPAIMHEPGFEFRTPIYFNWRHPNCSFAYMKSRDCDYKGPGIPLTSQPTPTQVAQAAGFQGFIRFIPATNLFYVYPDYQKSHRVSFYLPEGAWEQGLIGVWRRESQGLPFSAYAADTPPEQALIGEELYDAEERVRPTQNNIVMLGNISTKAAFDRLESCRCTDQKVAPTNLPNEICLQFPPGHGYRYLHRGWICDHENQRFTCKGKGAVKFTCAANAAASVVPSETDGAPGPTAAAALGAPQTPLAQPEPLAPRGPCGLPGGTVCTPEPQEALVPPSCSHEKGYYCSCTGPCTTTGKDASVWLFGKGSRVACEETPFGERFQGFLNAAWSRACPNGTLREDQVGCRAYKWWDDPTAPWGHKTPFLWGKDYYQICMP